MVIMKEEDDDFHVLIVLIPKPPKSKFAKTTFDGNIFEIIDTRFKFIFQNFYILF